jgi:RHS repeat-associated protein
MIATYAPLNNYEPAFFYHSDHLGSSSYITDKTGLVTQSFAYLPYGEQWVDVSYQNPAFATTYKFSGKEKDEETGFGYFGARYYYDYLSIWLSTDPHADNYPHLSPYNYCSNNPIMKIDPDGKDEWELNSETGKISWISDKDENGKDILRNQDRSDKVNVTKGVLTKKVGGFANNEEWETNNNKEVLLIEFGTNEQEAVDVFEFLSDNVSPDDNGYVVEFSLTGYSENQFMITSSYEYGGDLFGSALIQDKSLNTFYNAHNHNNSPLPSRGVDTGVRNNVLGINKNATMEIYHNRRYLDYTNPTNYKTTGGARSKRNIK